VLPAGVWRDIPFKPGNRDQFRKLAPDARDSRGVFGSRGAQIVVAMVRDCQHATPELHGLLRNLHRGVSAVGERRVGMKVSRDPLSGGVPPDLAHKLGPVWRTLR